VTTAIVAGQGSPAAQEKKGPKQKFEKLAEGVYAGLPTPGSDVSANSGFIVGKEGVYVFDALRPEVVNEMMVEIKKVTPLPIKYVFNSHHHYELVMGNPFFPGATIVAHENVRKNLISNPPAKQIEWTRSSNQKLGLPDSSEDAPPVVKLPDLTFTDRIVFYEGDRELHFIHLGRYHTDADGVLFLPKEKILFSGDLLPGMGGPGGQREAYFRDFITSLDKALALDFTTIVPGRGAKLGTKDNLRTFQTYFRELLAEVQKYVDKGATVEEAQKGIKPLAYLDPKRLDTAGFKRLWADTIERSYKELKAAKSGSQQ
jgi:glyoxylase-like metal-dependent hydrolase (beta-lactamase superfamily II)